MFVGETLNDRVVEYVARAMRGGSGKRRGTEEEEAKGKEQDDFNDRGVCGRGH
jgi:hypothetical protein